MSRINYEIGAARRKASAIREINRWLWSMNMAIMAVAIWQRQYVLASAAGMSWSLALLAAALGKRMDRGLGTLERATSVVRDGGQATDERSTDESRTVRGSRRGGGSSSELLQQEDRRPMSIPVQSVRVRHNGRRVRIADCPGRGQMMLH